MTVIENEMTTKPLRRVFIWTGQVAHLVDDNAPHLPGDAPERRPSLCGMKPFWPGAWFGEGSEEDRERLASMPTCGRCAFTLEVIRREQRS